jgi:hypothetical protein
MVQTYLLAYVFIASHYSFDGIVFNHTIIIYKFPAKDKWQKISSLDLDEQHNDYSISYSKQE